MTTQPTKIILPGIIERLVEPVPPNEPPKAQIAIEGADALYREIRIENTLKNEDGNEVSLKPGVPVTITIKAVPATTIAKP
jgi:hypothetical protein